MEVNTGHSAVAVFQTFFPGVTVNSKGHNTNQAMEKVRVPRKVFNELTALNREIHYTLDFNAVITAATNRGYMTAAHWLEGHEEEFRRGWARGFEPED